MTATSMAHCPSILLWLYVGRNAGAACSCAGHVLVALARRHGKSHEANAALFRKRLGLGVVCVGGVLARDVQGAAARSVRGRLTLRPLV